MNLNTDHLAPVFHDEAVVYRPGFNICNQVSDNPFFNQKILTLNFFSVNYAFVFSQNVGLFIAFAL